MPNRDLQLGLWMLTLRSRQRKLLLAVLILVDAVCIGSALFQGARFARTPSSAALAASLAASHEPDAAVLARFAPPVIAVKETAVVTTTGSVYDLVAVVANPSSRWMLTRAAYAFRSGTTLLAEGTMALRPGEERFLIVPGLRRNTAALPANVQVAASQTQWQRVDPGEPPPPALIVRNPAYRILSTAPSAPVGSVTAEIENPSAVDTFSADVTAILRNGNTVVGAAQLRIENLAPSSTRGVDIRLFRLLTVTDVQVRAAVVES